MKQLFCSFLAVILIWECLYPWPSIAQTAPADLDLSSSDPVRQASAAGQFDGAIIQVDGSPRPLTPADNLTAAEFVALSQVLSGGQQLIQINRSGQAVGGSFDLSALSNLGVASLVIPSGVTAVHDFGRSPVMALSGDLSNAGSLLGVSTNPAVTAGTFSAASITNLPGSVISTIVPAVLPSGLLPVVSQVDLTLLATGNITNAGQILSSGNLTASAGGSVVNALAGAAAGPAPVMAAAGNLNIYSGAASVLNSGLIASSSGNINIASALANLLINNASGRLQAASGNIDVRDALCAGKYHTDILGGDILARELNIFSGTGIAAIAVDELTARVNIHAGEAHVTAATDSLIVGDMYIVGDPTYYNTAGAVVISGALNFSGQNLAIVAATDITTGAGAGAINTGSAGASGGSILMAAGAAFTSSGPASGSNDTTSTLTITGASLTGGKIDLATGTPITSLTTRSTLSSGSGGNVRLIAAAGSNSGSGTIILPTGVTIRTGGGATGASNGDVEIIAGAALGATPSISVGPINTTGAANGTGSIRIDTATPILPAGPVTILNGAVTGGSFGAGTRQESSISAGTLTSSGGSVTVNAGFNALTGSIATNGSGSQAGGSVSISSDSATVFNIATGATVNGVNGTISANAGTSGKGGSIVVANNGSGGLSLGAIGNVSATATAGGGGTLSLNAGSGTLTIPAGTLSFSGAGAGTNAGGEIELFGAALNVTGGTLTLSANGSQTAGASGAGGLVSVTVASATSDLTVGTGTGNLVVNARNGNAGGDGGQLFLSAGRNLTVAPAQVNLAPQSGSGKGAVINLRAGTQAPGNLRVTAALRANGRGAGDGGSITLVSNSTAAFNLGSSTTNGVGGVTSANAGGTSGKGGSVTVVNNGTGGITLGAIGNLTSTVTAGGGGSLELDAGSGVLTVPNGTLSAAGNGNGAGDEAGGSIALRAFSLAFSGGGTLTLNADASQTAGATGRGGIVSVTTTSPVYDLTIGTGANDVTIRARGAVAGGDGGDVTVSSGRILPVDPAALSIGPQVSGRGAKLTLVGGNAGLGPFNITGSLSVNGVGTGDGGELNLSSVSRASFRIGDNASANYINGSLSANSGAGGGAGGTINVRMLGPGGITVVSAASLSATASAGVGGKLLLDAGEGELTLAGGTLAVNGAGSGAGRDGGTITLYGGSIAGSGTLNLDASASQTAGASGTGGAISVTAASAISDLFVGGGTLNFVITNRGGIAGGDGGLTSLAAGRDLTVAPASLQSGPQAGNSKGATLTLTAGTAGAGNLIVSGALSANGVGAGDGGTVNLTSHSASAFTLGSSAVNGVAGVVSVDATGPGGSGGKVTVVNSGSGGITLASPGNVTAAVVAGDGGELTLTAASGPLTLPAGTVSRSGSGSGARQGGRIILSGASLSVSGGALVLAADASQTAGATGGGGFISIVLSDPLADLSIGSAAGSVAVRALGGAAGGDAGAVVVSVGQHLFVDPAALTVAPQGSAGSGGRITLAAGSAGAGNLSVTAGIQVSGLSAGAGGLLNLSSRSAQPFVIGDGTVNGVTGALAATGGATSGDGGEITISNYGQGGISVSSLTNLTAAAVAGNGGSLTLAAGPGPLSIPSGTLSMTGAGTGEHHGGTIQLSGSSLAIGGAGALTLAADASQTAGATGLGGSISVSLSGPSAGLTVGPAQGNLIVFARGGVAGGDGGRVSLVAGGNLTVAPAYINAAPQAGNGKGAAVELTAGSAGSGNLLVTGALSASGIGSGSGGSISLTSNSATDFLVSSAATVSGVQGALMANSGPSGGGGGSIAVVNKGSGGITIGAISNLSASAVAGAGGTYVLDAAAGPIAGPLSIPTGTLSVSAAAGNFTGGTIRLYGSIITVAGGALTLSADAAGSGDGGVVTVVSTSNTAAGDLSIGNSPGSFIINVRGGSASALGGNGGTVAVSAGRNLSVSPGFLNAGPQGTNGDGAVISLAAGGPAAAGNLTLSAGLSANGAGIGAGGSLALYSNSTTAFNIGTAGSNGVNGALTVNAGGTSGDGGTLSVINYGSGGVTLAAIANLSLTVGSGRGATLVLDAGAGALALPSGTISASAGPGGFDGGSISLSGATMSVSGGAITLNANASGIGNGGSISLRTTGAAGNITIGAAVGNFILSARGGAASSAQGNGGSVTVLAGGNLTVAPASLTAGPLGSNGNGASIVLGAGTQGAAGNLVVSAAINANGSGLGAGGTVSLSSNSSIAFNVGTAGSNGVAGAVAANAGATSGAGGTVSVANRGTGGITLGAIGNISVSPTAGRGGSITLDAHAGAAGGLLTIPAGTLSAAAGAGNFDGGSITLRGTGISATGGALTLNADATGGGRGGVLSVTSTATTATGDLTVGASTGNVILRARGGSTNSATGDGGTVSVYAGRNLTVAPASLSANPLGLNGSGGQVLLSAGGNLVVSGSINVDSSGGNGTGAGGVLTLVSNSATPFNIGTAGSNGVTGTVGARAAGIRGQGGTVIVRNYGTGGITLGAAANVLVTAAFGPGGSLTLDAAAGAAGGALTIPTGTLAANADPGILTGLGVLSFNGGSITLRALSLNVTGGALTLSANPVGNGNGGTVSVTTTSTASAGDLTVGTGSGQLIINAVGGSSGAAKGDGGTVILSAGRNLTVNPSSSSLNVYQLGGNGTGPNILLQAGSASTPGNLLVSAALNASGLDLGNGGVISLISNSPTAFNIGTAGTNGVQGAVTSVEGSAPFAGGAIAITNYGSGGIVIGANVAGGPITTTSVSAGTSVEPGISVQSDANIVMNVNGSTLTNHGLVTSTARGASITMQSTGALTVAGTGAVTVSGGGLASILVQSSAASALSFTGSQTFNPGALGSVRFHSQATGGSITVAAAAVQTIAAGASLTVSTPLLAFTGAGATITASGASAVLVDSGGGANDLTVRINDGVSSATISTNGGSIAIVPTEGRSLTFAKTGGAGLAQLNLTGGTVSTTTSTTGATNVDSGVTVASDNNLTVNINSSTLNNNGRLSISPASGALLIKSTAGLTIAGAGVIELTGNAFPYVLINVPGANVIAMNGLQTFRAPNSPGNAAVLLWAPDAGGTVSFGSGSAQTVEHGMWVDLSAPFINFGGGAQITATGDSVIQANSGCPGCSLLVTLPDSSSATISTGVNAYHYWVAYDSATNVTFAKAAGPGTTVLNLNGAPVYTGTMNGIQTIGPGVTLASNSSVLMQAYGTASVVNNGTVSSSQAGGYVQVENLGGVLSLSGSGGKYLSSGSSGLVRVVSNDTVSLDSSLTFDAGSTGIVEWVAPDVGLAAGTTQSVTGRSELDIFAARVNFGSGAGLTTDSTAGIAVGVYDLNFSGLAINLAPASPVTITSSGGRFEVVSSNGFTLQTASGTSALNLNGGDVAVITNNGNQTIGAGVTLSSNENLYFNLNQTASFIDNGTITTSKAAGSITITGGGACAGCQFTLAGTPQLISVTGGGAASITVIGFGGLAISSSYSFNAGWPGVVTIAAAVNSAGTVGANAGVSVTGYSLLNLSFQTLTLDNNALITSNANSGTGIVLTSPQSNMLIQAPGGAIATLATQGAAIVVGPPGGLQTLTFARSGGAGTATLQFNNGPVSLSTDLAALSVGANVAVTSNNQLAVQAMRSGLVNSGTITGTAASGFSTTVVAQTLTNNGTISAAGGGNLRILGAPDHVSLAGSGVLSAPSITIQGSANGDVSGSQGSVAGTLVGQARSFAFATTLSGLTVGSITAIEGDLTLTAGTGVLSVAAGATLNAYEGNLTVKNADTGAGSIFVGYGAILNGYTYSKDTGKGNVYVVLGAVPVSPVAGSQPANVLPVISGDGAIYWGANSILANAPTNVVNALDRTVIFNTGSRPAAAITLDGAVTIIADPPGTGVDVVFAADLPSPQSRPALPVVAIPASTMTMLDGLGGFASYEQEKEERRFSASVVTGLEELGVEGPQAGEFEEADEDGGSPPAVEGGALEPIAYVRPAAGSALPPAAVRLRAVDMGGARVHHTGSARLLKDESGDLTFTHGEILLTAKENTILRAGPCLVETPAGSVVSLSRSRGVLKVRNLVAGQGGALTVYAGRSYFAVGPGREAVVGPTAEAVRTSMAGDRLGRRQPTWASTPEGMHVAVSEFSVISLLRRSATLSALLKSAHRADRKTAGSIVKMAAVLMLATGQRGPYSATRR